MVKVCEDWYPKGTVPYQKSDGFYIDPLLKQQLDILLKNIEDDWDFTIIISAGGGVGTGKSVLAQQIGAYWCYMVEKLYNKKTIFNLKNSIVFRGEDLLTQGHFLGTNAKNSALIFDEAGADLESRKVLRRTTQNVMDYMRECRQYNLLNILVIPDFFDLPKGIALTRSICLLDVYHTATTDGKFVRGYFRFFNKTKKKNLYIKGKKLLNYFAEPFNFKGRFYKFYPISEEDYRLAKLEALKGRGDESSGRTELLKGASWIIMSKELGLTHQQISDYLKKYKMNIDRSNVSRAIRRFIREMRLDEDLDVGQGHYNNRIVK